LLYDLRSVPDLKFDTRFLSGHAEVLRQELNGTELVVKSNRDSVLSARDGLNGSQLDLVDLLRREKTNSTFVLTHEVGDVGKSHEAKPVHAEIRLSKSNMPR